MQTHIVVWASPDAADTAGVSAAAADAATACNAALQTVAGLDDAVAAALRDRREPAATLLVLAPGDAPLPLATLRRLSRQAHDVACVFVLSPAHEHAMRRTLVFLKPPGGRWQIEAAGDPGLAARIAQTLQSLVQRQRLRTTLDRLRPQMPAVSTVDALEHRRLMASDLFFSTVLRHASDAIVAVDDRGLLQLWNAGAARLFGLTDAEALGRPLTGLFDDPAAVAGLLQRALAASCKAELRAQVAGSDRIIEATADALLDPRGGPLGVLAILRDVTAEHQAQQALLDAARQKDEFLAMLAHELRNPLTPIRNAAQLLKRLGGDADPRLGKAAEIIARQVNHLTSLVDDLLDVARVKRGMVTLQAQPVDLRAVLDTAVEQSRALVDQKQLTLTITVGSGLVVAGDADRLVQSFANLVNNAVKFTGNGGDIALTAQARDGDVVVSVADNGIGIPRSLLPHVFELFSQGQRGADRAQGGLGIGLALVKTLVELHGGSVDARSGGAGLGSEFVVTLPRVATAPPPDGGSAAAQAPVPAAPDMRLHLMVVDDNPDIAETLGELLEAEGHVVDVNLDPVAALAKAQSVAPDVFILDIGMPRMDGYELAARLRDLPAGRDAMLIALTGYGQPEDRQRALRAGFDHHLIKPLDTERLAWLLAQVVPRSGRPGHAPG